MILSPSEVASAAKWSVFWEYCEYVSEAVVFIGCVGEYIAEYTRWRTEEARHSLGRISLIVLILGLGSGLFSLVKTNALAGQFIGSLGEQAEQSNKKAETAIGNSEKAIGRSHDALVNSGTANSAANRASGAAKAAEKSADSALGLASDATRQAGDLGRDLIAAKQRESELEARAAALGQQLINLAVCNTPRVIDTWRLPGGPNVDALKTFAGRSVIIDFIRDPEAKRAATYIGESLKAANWDIKSFGNPVDPSDPILDGVEVQPYQSGPVAFLPFDEGQVRTSDEWAADDAVMAVLDFLHSFNWRATQAFPMDATGRHIIDGPNGLIPPKGIRIRIGLYPATVYVSPPGSRAIDLAISENVRKNNEREKQIRQDAISKLPTTELRKRAEDNLRKRDESEAKRDGPCRQFAPPIIP